MEGMNDDIDSELRPRPIACDVTKDNRDSNDLHLRERYELFEQVATLSIQIKEDARSNRCLRCWHDRTLRCICHLIPSLSMFDDRALPMSNVRFLILMHYKEYLSAGDDAKLLPAMLPPRNVKVFIFGRKGDWQAFEEELSLDPIHTLTLWPGEGAIMIDNFLTELPINSRWRLPGLTAKMPSANITMRNEIKSSDDGDMPMLRAIVLDGVYSHARTMFKTMRQRLIPRGLFPKFVALHPDTVSVYHRAQKNYAAASAATVAKSKDPNALHICTVEACALLLRELDGGDGGGDTSCADEISHSLIRAVRINNEALVHCPDVRPRSGISTSKSSGAAKRSQRKREARERAAEAEASAP
ncbi:hypothetical protein ACHAXA_002754 [Cyclostephanos tholiformis]|jgi:DTW domain-containing protein YfiP|uniref:tRNA-uridine aminocarboxypropyltransferase n=1 Tax=Cyclostephanos tholiformis TaxID=382380 RepID=A0ABD3RDU1_9STRA